MDVIPAFQHSLQVSKIPSIPTSPNGDSSGARRNLKDRFVDVSRQSPEVANVSSCFVPFRALKVDVLS